MRDLMDTLYETRADYDPVKAAQQNMRPTLPKRFYKDAAPSPVEGGGFAVLLDGRTVRTPGRKVLAVPNNDLAALLTDEFLAQKDVIDPATMPLLRMCNAALDGVSEALDAVVADMARYFASDLLCYRAEAPEGLVARQNEAWQPVLDWAEKAHAAPLHLTAGVMFVDQPETSLANLRTALHAAIAGNPFRATAAHVVTTTSGSALMALALSSAAVSINDVIAAAEVDERWNEEQWGADAEALRVRAFRARDLEAAGRILALTD